MFRRQQSLLLRRVCVEIQYTALQGEPRRRHAEGLDKPRSEINLDAGARDDDNPPFREILFQPLNDLRRKGERRSTNALNVAQGSLFFLLTGKFVISALGMILVVFMTDFARISLSTDRVHGSKKPETWNIAGLVTMAMVPGVLMIAESIGLFLSARDTLACLKTSRRSIPSALKS